MGCACADELLQPILRAERIERLGIGAACDDLARDVEHRVGLRGQQRLGGEISLGHPRTFVQQARGFEQRLDVDFARLATELAQALHAGVEQLRVRRVAEELELRGPRHARSGTSRLAPQPRRAGKLRRARPGVRGVELHRDRRHARRVLGGEREDRHGVQRSAGGHHAAHAQTTERGLVADEIVECGGHAARARGVGAQRETREPERHGHGGTARGAAADVRGIERVAADPVGRARAHEPGGELIEIGLAERDGAGVDQRLHHGSGFGGLIGERRRSPPWSAGRRSRCCP